MSLNRLTSRRKASVSDGLVTGVSAGLRGHAADESGPELLGALPDGRVAQPGQGAEDRAALVVVQLVLGEDGLRRALQVREEVGIDHDPPDELHETLRHGAADDTKRRSTEKGLARRHDGGARPGWPGQVLPSPGDWKQSSHSSAGLLTPAKLPSGTPPDCRARSRARRASSYAEVSAGVTPVRQTFRAVS